MAHTDPDKQNIMTDNNIRSYAYTKIRNFPSRMAQTFFRNELEDLGVLIRNMKEQNIVSNTALNS